MIVKIIMLFLIVFSVFTNNNKTYCEWKDIELIIERIKSISGSIEIPESKKYTDDELFKFKLDKFKYWLFFKVCYYSLYSDLQRTNQFSIQNLLTIERIDFMNIDMVTDLIITGAKYKQLTREKKSEIIVYELPNALNNNSFEMIKLLVEKGYLINDFYFIIPTMSIAVKSYYFSEKVIDYLLENGGDINVIDKEYKKTPLFYILDDLKIDLEFTYGKQRIITLDEVKYLVKQGADVKAKDYEGNNVLFYAKKTGNEEIIKYLEEELKKPNRIHQGVVLLKTYLLRVFYDKRRAEILKRDKEKFGFK